MHPQEPTTSGICPSLHELDPSSQVVLTFQFSVKGTHSAQPGSSPQAVEEVAEQVFEFPRFQGWVYACFLSTQPPEGEHVVVVGKALL